MPGALLRSGTLKEFKSLGVDGQPVYSAALQLREATRLRLGKEAADYLAIPQPNDSGDRIDWYAPSDGDVVPWSAATPEERADAYQQLEALHQQILPLSSEMSASDNREHNIFGRLLSKTIQFPDENHVYLVNGKPVITFWGFTGQAGGNEHDPLFCLRPAPPAPAPAAPAPPVAAAPVETAARAGWLRWLWWLLPLLLLLLLLLFFLRACVPSVTLPFDLGQIDLPVAPVEEVEQRDVVVERDPVTVGTSGVVGVPAEDGVLAGDAELPLDETLDGAGALDETVAPGEEGIDPNAQDPAAEQAEDGSVGDDQTNQPANEDENAGDAGQEQNPQQSADNAGAADMTIPPEALQSGSTRFLDGNWRAGSGIQDSRTGKPMSLAYDFKDGKGEVVIQRGDGVECRGGVNAAVAGGQVAINNQGVARCTDGSTYKLPEVTCAPNAKNVADCTGSYGDQRFPISMKQGGE